MYIYFSEWYNLIVYFNLTYKLLNIYNHIIYNHIRTEFYNFINAIVIMCRCIRILIFLKNNLYFFARIDLAIFWCLKIWVTMIYAYI